MTEKRKKLIQAEKFTIYKIKNVWKPSQIRILSPREFHGITGRTRGDDDGICSAMDGALECECASGLVYEAGTCRDIDECSVGGPLQSSCENINHKPS